MHKTSDGRTAAAASTPVAPVRARRTSKAPSERSVKSVSGINGKTTKVKELNHPGIIRLFSTFNDATSLYFVLELASKGELLTYLRKYGSLDLESSRYYAALLLDTIEFMHERGVVHRDLKPENILLDEDMRVKVTDFGSAKLLKQDPNGGFRDSTNDPTEQGETQNKKRSFVGSADFVSPEVLRNEPAVAASDIWAFGCIVYQLIVGKPPFRGATDYLTFQKILKRNMDYPEGFDKGAKDLVEMILNLDPNSRPTASALKSHPFFTSIDWSTIWKSPAPTIYTGITDPVITLASVNPDSDMWAVFEDEMSDNGQPDDNGYYVNVPSNHAGSTGQGQDRLSPRYDHQAAAEAVWAVDSPDADQPRQDPMNPSSGQPGRSGPDPAREAGGDDLEPPKPAWMESSQRKLRALSRGSARTSSSSSGNRTALTGLLETMGIVSGSGSSQNGSGRTSRASGSVRMEDTRSNGVGARVTTPRTQRRDEVKVNDSRWNQLLLTNESILYTSSILIKTSTLPSFLSPNSTKRRQLILTDLPRLILVKEESASNAIHSSNSLSAASQASLSIKNEFIFPGPGLSSGNGNNHDQAVVVEVLEKGNKGFTIQTSYQSFSYLVESTDLRDEWLNAIRNIMS